MLNETEPLLVAKFEQILITDFCSKGPFQASTIGC